MISNKAFYIIMSIFTVLFFVIVLGNINEYATQKKTVSK